MEVDNCVELLIHVTGMPANVIPQARSTVVMHHNVMPPPRMLKDQTLLWRMARRHPVVVAALHQTRRDVLYLLSGLW